MTIPPTRFDGALATAGCSRFKPAQIRRRDNSAAPRGFIKAMTDLRHQPPKPNVLDPNEIIGTTAKAHVGKTLESDPKYNDRPEWIPDIAGDMTSRGGNDLSATPDMRAGSDPLLGMDVGENGNPVEPLKTRLPGDTSSDPHTDLGANNAANLQNGSNARRSKKK
jgi:hypothetical protein